MKILPRMPKSKHLRGDECAPQIRGQAKRKTMNVTTHNFPSEASGRASSMSQETAVAPLEISIHMEASGFTDGSSEKYKQDQVGTK